MIQPIQPIRPTPLLPARFKDRTRTPSSAGIAERASPEATHSAGGGRLVCATCDGFLTESRSRVEVNGAHAHTFINPAGIVFKVGCFADASGALSVGEESQHWTWFPGFAWRAAVCRACSQHLGWRFRNTGNQFFALILDRVIEIQDPSSGP